MQNSKFHKKYSKIKNHQNTDFYRIYLFFVFQIGALGGFAYLVENNLLYAPSVVIFNASVNIMAITSELIVLIFLVFGILIGALVLIGKYHVAKLKSKRVILNSEERDLRLRITRFDMDNKRRDYLEKVRAETPIKGSRDRMEQINGPDSSYGDDYKPLNKYTKVNKRRF